MVPAMPWHCMFALSLSLSFILSFFPLSLLLFLSFFLSFLSLSLSFYLSLNICAMISTWSLWLQFNSISDLDKKKSEVVVSWFWHVYLIQNLILLKKFGHTLLRKTSLSFAVCSEKQKMYQDMQRKKNQNSKWIVKNCF